MTTVGSAVVLLCGDAAEAGAALASELGVEVQQTGSLAEVALRVAALGTMPQHGGLVVIGADVPLADALGFAGHAAAQRPELPVVLLRSTTTPGETQAAEAAGVREVVSATDLRRLTRVSRRALTGPSQHRGSVSTVYSPKGGTGKTTVATNLAAALAATGATVCLVDLDLEFGDVGLFLGLTPTRTLADAVATPVVDLADLSRTALLRLRPGLDCVLAPLNPGQAATVTSKAVGDLLALVREHYAHVVVDTPSQLSDHVLTALDLSDRHVLVTNPELPALKNLQLAIDTLDLLGHPTAARTVVLNRADRASGISAADARAVLDAPVDLDVPASRDVPASINAGTPLVTSRPKHPVSAAITALAARIVAAEAPVAPAGLQQRRSRLFPRRSA